MRGIAAFLRGQGIATGDRIALAADNSIEHVLCYLGIMAYGATVCTVHVEMNRPHLPRILAQLRPRLVIHDEGIELPSAASCLAIGRCDAPAAGSFFAAVDPDAGAEHFLTETTACDDGVIFFTSGTSDTPKGVVLSYREQLGNILPMTEGFGINGEDRIYDFRSFNWASAQLLGVLAPLARGATLVMAKKFSATRFFEDVRTHGVTVAAGNPTVINMLLAAPIKIGPQDVPSLRFVTSSSAPLLPRSGGASRSASAYRSPRATAAARPRGSRSIPAMRGGSAVSAVRSPITGSPSSAPTAAPCRRARPATSSSARGTTTTSATSATTAACG